MFHMNRLCRCSLLIAASSVLALASGQFALASTTNPQSGSIGLEGTISANPPSQAASVSTPSSGASFTSSPITMSGLCTTGLLVKIFDNNVFVGSTVCTSGSYSLKVALFSGQNSLIARVYDSLDQAGPDSNAIIVTYASSQFSQPTSQLTLTSQYGRLGTDPGQQLTWPIVLDGGTGPYALSVDWGDGSNPELASSAYSGIISIKHTYTNAGTYEVTVQATDANGLTAYLQLVAVADGQVSQSPSSNGSSGSATTQIKTQIIWWPALLFLPLILAAFWLGQRNELFNLRKRLEQDR